METVSWDLTIGVCGTAPAYQECGFSPQGRAAFEFAAGQAVTVNRPDDDCTTNTHWTQTMSQGKPIKVLLVNKHSNKRANLLADLENNPRIKIVAAVADGATALEQINQYQPDVVLSGFYLEDMTAPELVHLVKSLNIKTEFLLYTRHADEAHLFSALQAGATGYILEKDVSNSRIVSAILELSLGGAPMSFGIARKVLRYFQKPDLQELVIEQLTRRELEILRQLAQGFCAKRIALNLAISYQTVRTHQKNIYRKLQVNSVTEAINVYREFAET